MKDYKRIPFPHLFNCRDLGGYACAKDNFFAYHKIYRSDLPIGLGEEEWRYLREEMGVRTIIDLRSTGEQKMMPYQAPEGILYISCPLMAEGDGAENPLNDMGGMSDAADEVSRKNLTIEELAKIREKLKERMASSQGGGFTASLEKQYEEMVEEDPKQAARILNLVGEHVSKGAVLYHCYVGKDRTGVISALIYMLCGVAEADILADYQVSGDYLRQNELLFASIPEEIHHMMESNAGTMRHFLKMAKERDYMGILYKNGLKESAVETIKKAVMQAL